MEIIQIIILNNKLELFRNWKAEIKRLCESFLLYLGIAQTIQSMCDITDIISRERRARFTRNFLYLKDARNIEEMLLQ